MTFMAFSQLSGDMSSVSENVELASRLYGAEGASLVAGSVALTGPNVGSFTLSTMWDSSDACFAAREKVLGSAEMQTAMAAAQSSAISKTRGRCSKHASRSFGKMKALKISKRFRVTVNRYSKRFSRTRSGLPAVN